MFNWYFNPFIKIAGVKALVVGLTILILASLLGYFNGIHFDGVLDIHFGLKFSVEIFLYQSLLSWVSASIVFYIMGIVLSKSSIRMIDVFGTQALARYPMIGASLLGFIPYFQDMQMNGIPVIVFGLTAVLLAIWYITLMYNAYKISCNLKGNPLIFSFIAGIILSEIASKIFIYLIYKLLIA